MRSPDPFTWSLSRFLTLRWCLRCLALFIGGVYLLCAAAAGLDALFTAAFS
ncbi:MAG: hypothetical protein HY369_01520 [Candidatus Aenigmarchaeota archaeon]|nr:hypothetical protein [Candidatus Aenigmarchaeota archaeon]